MVVAEVLIEAGKRGETGVLRRILKSKRGAFPGREIGTGEGEGRGGEGKRRRRKWR